MIKWQRWQKETAEQRLQLGTNTTPWENLINEKEQRGWKQNCNSDREGRFNIVITHSGEKNKGFDN